MYSLTTNTVFLVFPFFEIFQMLFLAYLLKPITPENSSTDEYGLWVPTGLTVHILES